MSGITTYLANQVLEAIFNGGTVGPYSSAWIQLHVGDPGTRGESNPAVNNTRQEMFFEFVDCFSWSNLTEIVWNLTPAAETYTHVSLWTDVSAGRAIWSGPLVPTNPVNVDDSFTITTGSLTVSLT